MGNHKIDLKIISGGQTGVDRAALDAALTLGISCGGWCPKGRRAEDGPIPDRYPVKETESASYPVRTEMNVRDSDGTLILTWGRPTGGTALTIRLTRRHKKPSLIIDLKKPADPSSLMNWLEKKQIGVLNVAGPRESEYPGISRLAFEFLLNALGTEPT
jgi:predicted Rossmann-fold nucleotide-binding protein